MMVIVGFSYCQFELVYGSYMNVNREPRLLHFYYLVMTIITNGMALMGSGRRGFQTKKIKEQKKKKRKKKRSRNSALFFILFVLHHVIVFS